MLKTPLHQQHLQLNARMVDYAGWHMPISYKSPIKEHMAVRTDAGMFDVSHMGEFAIIGEDASALVSRLTTCDVSSTPVGSCRYAGLLNSEGGFIDDLIIYKLSSDNYMFCVNAANVAKDFEWIIRHTKNFTKLRASNISDKTALLAIQGRTSLQKLQGVKIDGIRDVCKQKPFTIKSYSYREEKCLVATTGYTGEKGVEIFLPNYLAESLWSELYAAGVEPCGLASRDSLRLESGLTLYGKDINEQTTPKEAGLSWIIKNNTDFIGSENAATNLQNKSLVAFKMLDAAIARDEMPIYSEVQGGTSIGQTTSATYLPHLGMSGGFAFIDTDFIRTKTTGANFYIDIRGKRKLAQIEKRPLYNREK